MPPGPPFSRPREFAVNKYSHVAMMTQVRDMIDTWRKTRRSSGVLPIRLMSWSSCFAALASLWSRRWPCPSSMLLSFIWSRECWMGAPLEVRHRDPAIYYCSVRNHLVCNSMHFPGSQVASSRPRLGHERQGAVNLRLEASSSQWRKPSGTDSQV
jgi:hypothetical protein